MTRRRRQLLKPAEDSSRVGDLDNVTHFEPRRETVGDLLRRTRDGKGQQLDVVAMRLKIRAGYLKAIEEGRFQDLPGLTYAVGFVRTYAEHLGLDSEDVVRRFRDEVAELKSQTQLIFPVVAAEGKIPRGAILLLSAVLAAIAYGGWYYLSEREQSALDLIPELPAKLKALIYSEEEAEPPAASTEPASTEPASIGPAPAATSEAPASPAPAVPAATAPAEETAVPAAPAPAAESTEAASALPAVTPPPAVAPAAQDAADSAASAAAAASSTTEIIAQAPASTGLTASAPDAPTATQADAPPPPAPSLGSSGLPSVSAPAAPATGSLASAAPAPEGGTLPAAAEGQVFGATEGPSRIVMVARLESWVQVTDPETNALLTRVLRAGDRYYVPDQAGLTLATGNAGGLDIWVDGRKAPALGPVGVVRRDIALDPQRLADGTALPE